MVGGLAVRKWESWLNLEDVRLDLNHLKSGTGK